MLGLGWSSLLKGLAAIFCIVGVVSFALIYFIPAPPSTVVIAVGVEGGSFDRIALSYQERLARHHVTLDIRHNANSIGSLRAVEDQNSDIDAAFLFSSTTIGMHPTGLISLGRIDFVPIWVFYRGTKTLDRLTQLKGKRIGGPLTNQVIAKILSASGVNPGNTTMLTRLGPAGGKALQDGEVDAIINLGELDSPYIQSLLHDPSIRLMNMTEAEGLTRVFPDYLNRLVLPQGVVDFEKHIPPRDVSLIAFTGDVVVRTSLHPEIVYLLAQTAMEEHSGAGIFNRAGEFPTQTDPNFPMAESAVDFYKNGPPFLNRYLPFWMVPHVQRLLAVLLAGGAIVYPLFNFAPRLYRWVLENRMSKLYRRLRIVEETLQKELTASQVVNLQTDLENINRAAKVLPMRHSDLFFDFYQHIESTRTRLASRLVEARSQKAKAD